MEADVKKITGVLKQQIELFLLDAGEFYPFGTCINTRGETIPVGVQFENDHPLASDVITLLEKTFKEGVISGKYKIAGLAINVTISENKDVYDAVEMRFYEFNKDVRKEYLKYKIQNNTVMFW